MPPAPASWSECIWMPRRVSRRKSHGGEPLDRPNFDRRRRHRAAEQRGKAARSFDLGDQSGRAVHEDVGCSGKNGGGGSRNIRLDDHVSGHGIRVLRRLRL